MSTKIRLTRFGKKRSPFYRIIVTDEKNSRDGQYIDLIGIYDPFLEGENSVKIDEEKIKLWTSKGAVLTSTVKTLLTGKDIFEKIKAQKKKKVRKNRGNLMSDKIALRKEQASMKKTTKVKKENNVTTEQIDKKKNEEVVSAENKKE